MTPNDYDRTRWMDMLNIAYRTRPDVLTHERKITIEVSEDCLDNLAGLFGLLPEPSENNDFLSTFSSQTIQKNLVDKSLLIQYITTSDFMPAVCGNLSIQIVEGRGIFDIKFR